MKSPRHNANHSSYWVPILGSAIKILELFYESESDLTLHEVSTKAIVGKTSAFRILYTLENVGYVEKDETNGKYRLGLGIVSAARKRIAGSSLVQVARPHLKRLRDGFEETINLATLHKNEIVYSEIFESGHSFRMTDSVGSRISWHSTALGKAIAAFLPEERVKAILQKSPMKKFTPNTITSQREYLKVLANVKAEGFGLDFEESELGATCIASPIFGAENAIVGALSVSGPTPRIQSKQTKIIQALKVASGAISESLSTEYTYNGH
jgi:IclR family transcriptional regulator, acetate operon repressor